MSGKIPLPLLRGSLFSNLFVAALVGGAFYAGAYFARGAVTERVPWTTQSLVAQPKQLPEGSHWLPRCNAVWA